VVSTWRENSARDVIVAVQVIVAPTQAEADALAQKVEVWGVELANGQRVTVASEEQAYALRARRAASRCALHVGRSRCWRVPLSRYWNSLTLHQQWGIDEFIIDTPVAEGNARRVAASAGRGAS
jgi:alkanesulfonate monooxygenase SsuD/methylene tetrahydromethanopterin reductase-like flavin-dependent oxidoreductase (luciferase family)